MSRLLHLLHHLLHRLCPGPSRPTTRTNSPVDSLTRAVANFDLDAFIMSLPTELMIQISSTLYPPDLQNFRLVNKRFAAIGTLLLVPSITVKLLPDDFAKLIQISEHPELRHQVKEIVFMKDVVEACDGLEAWRRNLVNSRRTQYHGAWHTSQENPSAAQYYCQGKVRALQHLLLQPGLPQLKLCLDYALPRLPNLRTIKLTRCTPGRDGLGHRYLDGEIDRYWYMMSESLGIEGFVAGAEIIRTVVASAMDHSQVRFWSLHVDEAYFGLFDPRHEVFKDMCSGAASLTSLVLDFNLQHSTYYESWFSSYAGDDSTLARRNGVKTFLNSLPHLRSLDLDFAWLVDAHDYVTSSDILKGVVLPSLQTLGIAHLRIFSKDLVEFVASNAAKLEHLKLQDLTLQDARTSTCWCRVFDAVRKQSTLSTAKIAGFLYNSGSIVSHHSSELTCTGEMAISTLLEYFLTNDIPSVIRAMPFRFPGAIEDGNPRVLSLQYVEHMVANILDSE